MEQLSLQLEPEFQMIKSETRKQFEEFDISKQPQIDFLLKYYHRLDLILQLIVKLICKILII
jgi:hypothetical protein